MQVVRVRCVHTTSTHAQQHLLTAVGRDQFAPTGFLDASHDHATKLADGTPTSELGLNERAQRRAQSWCSDRRALCD